VIINAGQPNDQHDAPNPKNDQLTCSFCNRRPAEVKKMIAGPHVYICDECVDLCVEIIEQEKDDA
jgi:hypothetical protein